MSLLKSVTEEQFRNLVKKSYSIGTVISGVGLNPSGTNYKSFRTLSKRWNVDFSHFTGQAHLKGRNHSWTKPRPLAEVMVENSSYGSHKLRLRLIKAGIFEHRCVTCNQTEWLEKPIPLELDHINGDNTDNRIENLRCLCPNCHTLTDTYRGKNIGRVKGTGIPIPLKTE